MSRRLVIWLLLGIFLSACAALIPHEYKITRAQLTNKLNKSFPLHRTIAQGLFDATLDVPEFGFMTAQNRLSLAAHFSVHSIFRADIQGDFLMSGSLRYDPDQRAIFLQDAHLDTLQLEHNDAQVEMLRAALSAMLGEYLKDNALYIFQPDELRYAGVAINITNISIVEDGIKLSLASKN